MAARRDEAEVIFRRVGITFAVYGEKTRTALVPRRLIPFDLIPRIIPAHEWARMEKGLVQRVTALNRFIHDIYHGQDILRAGIVPREQVEGNAQFRPEMMGWTCPTTCTRRSRASTSCVRPMRKARANTTCWKTTCACPAGELYVGNRKMMMRLFPDLFSTYRVALWRITPTCCWRPCAPAARPPRPSDGGGADARHVQQRRTSSTPFSPANGVELSKGRTCSSKITLSTCAPRAGRAGWTSFTAAWTMTFWTRWCFAPIPPWVAQACWRPTGRQRDDLQRRGHGHCRRQVHLPLCAPNDPFLPGRRNPS